MPAIGITGNHMHHSQNKSAEPPGGIQAEKSPCVSCVSAPLFPGYSLSQGKVAFRVSETAWHPELERRLAKLPDPPESSSSLFWTLAQQMAPGSHMLLASAHAPSPKAGHWLPALSEGTGLTLALTQGFSSCIKIELSLITVS